MGAGADTHNKRPYHDGGCGAYSQHVDGYPAGLWVHWAGFHAGPFLPGVPVVHGFERGTWPGVGAVCGVLGGRGVWSGAASDSCGGDVDSGNYGSDVYVVCCAVGACSTGVGQGAVNGGECTAGGARGPP